MNLYKLQRETEKIALDFGLDFPEVLFEVVDWQQMNQVMAYNGFPVRFPHWSFGMAYNRHQRGFDWRAFRVYELVINTDPCIAYLLSSNEAVVQKMVMLHVYGHAHFFKNNTWFAHTNRSMLNEMANHATQVRRYIDRFGLEKVESFLDLLFSLDNLIDVHSVAIKRRAKIKKGIEGYQRLPAQGYMDRFINPEEELKRQLQKAKDDKKKAELPRKIPVQPEQDVLLFLLEHAPLKFWQQVLLEIIRDETYYFLPQMQTKIMNEGFATFIHSRLMTEKACDPGELIDYADKHSGVVVAQRGRLNPYRLGYQLLLDIEKRWNRGMFGRDWDECADYHERKKWDLGVGLGMQKVLEVIEIYNDLGFLDEFLTYDFAQRQRLFTYDYYKEENVYKISGRDFDDIKERLLFSRTNIGSPIIRVVDGNFDNKGELLLKHDYAGTPLDLQFVEGTLKALYSLWQRPVHIETIVNIYYGVYKYQQIPLIRMQQIGTNLKHKEIMRLTFDQEGFHHTSLGIYEGEYA